MDHVLMKVMELKLYVSDMENSREKSIILTKLDEIRHWATDLKAKNPKPGLVEELTVLENLKPIVNPHQ